MAERAACGGGDGARRQDPIAQDADVGRGVRVGTAGEVEWQTQLRRANRGGGHGSPACLRPACTDLDPGDAAAQSDRSRSSSRTQSRSRSSNKRLSPRRAAACSALLPSAPIGSNAKRLSCARNRTYRSALCVPRRVVPVLSARRSRSRLALTDDARRSAIHAGPDIRCRARKRVCMFMILQSFVVSFTYDKMRYYCVICEELG